MRLPHYSASNHRVSYTNLQLFPKLNFYKLGLHLL